MSAPKKQAAPYLMIIDPEALLPAMLLDELRSSPFLTCDQHDGVAPIGALLAVNTSNLPSQTLLQYRDPLNGIPIIVYDPAPSVSRQASTFNCTLGGGYVIEDITVAELLPLIELARTGGFGLSRAAFEIILLGMRAPTAFSPQERDVVALMAIGASSAVIAEDLTISEAEVDACIQRARDKVGVDSNAALALWWTYWTLNDSFLEEDGDGDEGDDETSSDTQFVVSA